MTKLMRSTRWLGVGALVFAAACGGGGSDGDVSDEAVPAAEASATTVGVAEGGQGDASGLDLDVLYEAALEEGKVIVYTATAESSFNSMLEGFSGLYPGIDVEFVRVNSSALSQRFGAELDSGAPTADLVGGHGAVEFHLAALERGWQVPLDELPLPEEFPSDFIDPALGPIVGHPLPVILYNTDLVGDDEIPTTWEDLADPKWKGQVLMADLEEQLWHVGVYGTVIEEFGEEWAEGFMANEPRVVSGGVAPITELIVAGEAAVAPIGFVPIAESLKASGAPIDYTFPDPQTSVPAVVAINATAENPNAARLLFHYMHTPDGVERSTLIGSHAPYQADRSYTWIPDDLRWVTDADHVTRIRGLFGQ